MVNYHKMNESKSIERELFIKQRIDKSGYNNAANKNYHRLRIKKLIIRSILRNEHPFLCYTRDFFIAVVVVVSISILLCWYKKDVGLIYTLAAILIVFLILLGVVIFIIGQLRLNLERDTKDFFE